MLSPYASAHSILPLDSIAGGLAFSFMTQDSIAPVPDVVRNTYPLSLGAFKTLTLFSHCGASNPKTPMF